MKRLLAYLFIVFGMGLTFSVSVEAKSLELCWKSLTGDEVLVTKHKSWKPGGSGCEYIHKTSDPILYKEVNRNLSKTTVTKGNNKIYSIRKINLKKILNDYYSRYRSLTTWTRIKTNKWLYPDFDINIAQAEASQTGMVAGKNTKIIIYRAKANSRTYDYSDTHGVSDDSMDQAIKNALKNCNYSIRNNRNYYKKKINDCKITSTDEEIVDTDPVIAKAEPSQTQKVAKKSDWRASMQIEQTKTKIAKVEEPKQEKLKPKKTNKQSKTKITKKIIKTDVSDLKVKDISTWEKNILEAIEKESSDPYCKLVDKKPKLNELKFKKNYCIKKSDILKLGKYKRFNTPQFLLTEMKNCKSNTCLADKAGKNVYKIFVQKTPIYHAKYPGDMIKGMVWFEILYQTKLKKLQKIIKRYEDQTYEGLWKLKKKNHESQIYSLIKLNNGRIKMRNALGFTVYNDLY
jgi:hypothetical protein